MALEKNKIIDPKRLVKNSMWLFGAEASSKVFGLATQIIAARYLGEKGYGNFSLAFALSGVFIVFIDTGLNVYVCQQVSRYPGEANKYLKSVFDLKKVLALPVAGSLISIVWLMPGENEIKLVVCAIGLALILNGFTEMYLSVFRAFEWMSLVCVLLITQRALFFFLGFVSLLMGYQVVPFSILFLVVSFLSLMLARWNMKKRSKAKESLVDWELSKMILKKSLPVWGVFLFSYIYFRLDVVIVYFMSGDAETGWYNAAFKWVEILALLVASIRAALFPALSRTHFSQDDQFQKIAQEAARYLFLIGIPLTIGTFVLAPQFVGLLYGDLYEMTVRILQIMALGIFLICFNEFAAYLLLSADRYREVLKVVILGAVLNIALNLMVIPKWGVMGAAAVAGFTELFLFYMFLNCMNRISIGVPIFRLFWRPALAAAAMGVILMQIPWPLIPLILIGIGVYFVMLLLLRTFNEYDFQVARNILDRIR
jgi:O-antigen/teichoic acid export membrane protein